MSDAKNHEGDALPELPDDALLEELEPVAPMESIAELPDDVEELTDELEELPAEVEELPEDVEPIAEKPKAPAAPVPAKPVPARKVAPKPAPARTEKPAPKPAAKPAAKPAPKPVAKPVAAKPVSKAASSEGGESGGAKKSPEEREAAKKEREAQRKLELDRAAGRTGQKRELDQAPLILRKASIIMGIAAVIPFTTVAWELWPMIFAGKALILIGGWIFHQSHVFTHEGKAPGFVASLSKAGKPAVYGVFGILALVGLWNFGDVDAVATQYGLGATEATLVTLGIIAEKLILLLALFTYTHIYDYEYGNKFNPIFPLMFLGGAIGGLAAVIKDIAPPPGSTLDSNFVAAIAAAGVGVGGCMAMWTMWLAMKEAKAQGEAKKLAAAEARKAARAARKG